MELSSTTRVLSGVILITVPTIEYGGTFLLGMLRSGAAGYLDNPIRQNLFRAGHAHAGVLVILAILCQLLVDAASLSGAWAWSARLGAPLAAILMPLGFFLSVAAPAATKPGPLIGLVYVGASLLAISMLVLGIALVRTA